MHYGSTRASSRLISVKVSHSALTIIATIGTKLLISLYIAQNVHFDNWISEYQYSLNRYLIVRIEIEMEMKNN